MVNSWLALVPPLLVIALTCLTRNVLFSLGTGIVSAALIVHNFVVSDALLFAGKRLFAVSELAKVSSWESFWTCSNLFLCLFLVLLGIVITLMHASGAAYAYACCVMKRVKTPAKAEASSLLLSTLFFIDDYFSCLTVGSVMQSITDSFKVPRVKLAVLINLIAAPLVVIVPITSWAAEIVGQLRNSGVGLHDGLVYADPFYTYLSTIPCVMYAFIMIATLWFMTWRRVSFGIIKNHEAVAQKNGNLFGGKTPVVRRNEDLCDAVKASSSLIDFAFPIALLVLCVPFFLVYWGDWWVFGGSVSFIAAIQKANQFSSSALFSSVVVTLGVTTLFFLVRKRIALWQLPSLFKEGFFVMGTTPIMLIFIWTLSGMLGSDLGTGTYLAALLMDYMSIKLLPVFFFLIAVVISIMISSSWATMGMLIPVALRLVPSFAGFDLPIDLVDIPLMMPVLGAIISGSLVGNHASPIADVILMSSSSAGAYHMDVVKAHLSISLPTVVATTAAFGCIGYTIAIFALWQSLLLGFCVGLVGNVSVLLLLSKYR